jgi:DNA invertase Pin-like site-specific DNA recombinase
MQIFTSGCLFISFPLPFRRSPPPSACTAQKGTLLRGRIGPRNSLKTNELDRSKGYAHNYSMKIGYARVSTDEQNLTLQLDALRGAGCEAIFEDVGSGADNSRKGLAAALDRCAAGDVLVAWKLDRLGRSTLDLVGLVEKLKGKDVGLKVLTGEGASIDTTRAEGKLIFAVFAAFAEFERELTRERTRAGMQAARRAGRHVGRPSTLTPEKLDLARRLIEEGKGRGVIARMVGVHPATLRRVLNGVKSGI